MHHMYLCGLYTRDVYSLTNRLEIDEKQKNKRQAFDDKIYHIMNKINLFILSIINSIFGIIVCYQKKNQCTRNPMLYICDNCHPIFIENKF